MDTKKLQVLTGLYSEEKIRRFIDEQIGQSGGTTGGAITNNTKKLQVISGVFSKEKIQQLIAEQLSKFFVIGDTEPDYGPCIWFDTSMSTDTGTEDSTVILLLSEEVDESEISAYIDDIGYGVTNAEAPVLADDGSTYTITIS